MAETEAKVQDLIRQFEDAARVVTSLNPDERKEFIRKYSISDVMHKVEVEMVPNHTDQWLDEETVKKLNTLYKSGGKSHTIGFGAAKGKHNKVMRSKSLVFSRKNNIERPPKKSIDLKNSQNKKKGTLITKKNSIKEESINLWSKVGPSKNNSVEESSPLATKKVCLVQKAFTEEENVGIKNSGNCDLEISSKRSRTKSISGTLKSMKGRLSTKRLTHKQRTDIRNIEFDGQPVNIPDSDAVILGSDHVGLTFFSFFSWFSFILSYWLNFTMCTPIVKDTFGVGS